MAITISSDIRITIASHSSSAIVFPSLLISNGSITVDPHARVHVCFPDSDGSQTSRQVGSVPETVFDGGRETLKIAINHQEVSHCHPGGARTSEIIECRRYPTTSGENVCARARQIQAFVGASPGSAPLRDQVEFSSHPMGSPWIDSSVRSETT